MPTSLAFGPDGALCIGTLAFASGPGGAKAYRLDLPTGKLSAYARGLTAITGIAFDKQGRLYVCHFTSGFDANGPSPNGAVVVVPRGGGKHGRHVLGNGVLRFPVASVSPATICMPLTGASRRVPMAPSGPGTTASSWSWTSAEGKATAGVTASANGEPLR